ncbi:MAG: response regulator [Gallionellaceae bacterium]
MKQIITEVAALARSGCSNTTHRAKPFRSDLLIQVVLADDHKVMLEALSMLLEKEKLIKIVGTSSDGRALLDTAASLKPDVVVMDVGMPGMSGIIATRRLVSAQPKTKVVALSAFAQEQYVLEMFKAGASAYVLKENASLELVRAIYAVMKGQKYLCPDVSAAVVNSTGIQPMAGSFQLSPRESEVLQLLAEGYRSPQIAKRLFISTSTVDVHRRNIMKKLELHNVADLTKYAISKGLTTVSQAVELNQQSLILDGQVEPVTDKLHSSQIETIKAIIHSAENRDDTTGGHVQRISQYSRYLAETLGMDSAYCDMINFASSVHDLGKILIPDYILLKQSALTPSEFDLIKSHCLQGVKIIETFHSPCMEMGAEIALSHHEKWDGTGYPSGLAGEDIPLAGRIAGICDVYDALRAKRPHKPAFDHVRCMRIIGEGDGRTMPGHFDPAILDSFKRCSQQFNEIFQSYE